MAKFEILHGKHHGFEYGEDGRAKKTITYRPGDVVESKKNLLSFNNPGCEKFKKVSDSTPSKIAPTLTAEEEENPSTPPESQDPFAGLTLAALKEVAEEEEIDLGVAKTKKEILSVLHKHVGG